MIQPTVNDLIDIEYRLGLNSVLFSDLKHYYAPDEDYLQVNYFGIELEYYFSPNYATRRALNIDSLMDTSIDLAENIVEANNCSPLLYKAIELDYSNVEIVFNPISLGGFKKLTPTMAKVLSSLEKIGFTADTSGYRATGLHITVNNDLTHEQIIRLYKLLFSLDDLFIEMSGRRGMIDKRADIILMLKHQGTNFRALVESIVRGISDNTRVELTGLRFYTTPKKSRVIQFTHFNCSLDYSYIVEKIEFVSSLLEFTKTTEEVLSETYLEWLKNNTKYEELVFRLEQTQFTVKDRRKTLELFGS